MSFDTLIYSKPAPGVALITFNRPAIKNAMDEDAMYDWATAIKQANADPSVNVIVVTGCVESGVFTAGARLSGDFGKAVGGSTKGVGNTTEYMINAHIDSVKPLIAACNGPAIGVGTTILGLYDFVYATPNCVMRVPFMPLAVGAEGVSSLTFQTVMGTGLANQMLFLDRTFPASKFVDCGFVTEILPKEEFLENVMKVAKELAGMPPLAVRGTRDLVIQHRYGGRERLRAINKAELENLAKM
jgi:peroxisomal 3,2-trans-enoyl-CoA isomerase